MKKIFILLFFMCIIIFPCFAETDPIETRNPQWVQISKKVWVDNNMARFISGTNYRQALIIVKILNDNNIPNIKNSKVWYAQGLYMLDCWENKIEVAKLFYYNLNKQQLAIVETKAKLPIETYEKEIVNYMCINKKNLMQNAEKKLQDYNQEDYYRRREINALENIGDELYRMRNGL